MASKRQSSAKHGAGIVDDVILTVLSFTLPDGIWAATEEGKGLSGSLQRRKSVLKSVASVL